LETADVNADAKLEESTRYAAIDAEQDGSNGRNRRVRKTTSTGSNSNEIKEQPIGPDSEDANAPQVVQPDLVLASVGLQVIDPITLEVVQQKPAISPHGIVMEYENWVRCLSKSQKCPLTRQPVTRRQLVVLTMENIQEYKEKIKNIGNKQ
jgi:hypothetical protein